MVVILPGSGALQPAALRAPMLSEDIRDRGPTPWGTQVGDLGQSAA
jgi:hypothetical protein